MSLGLLMSSSSLTMWAYTNTTEWSVTWWSTFVPYQSFPTNRQSLRETRNIPLVWINSFTFHLHMIGIISANELCLSPSWFTDTIVCAHSSHCPEREQETGRKCVVNHTWSENPSAHPRGKQHKHLHAYKFAHGWNVLEETGRMWQGSANKQLQGSDSKQEDGKSKWTSCLGQWQQEKVNSTVWEWTGQVSTSAHSKQDAALHDKLICLLMSLGSQIWTFGNLIVIIQFVCVWCHHVTGSPRASL